MRGVAESQVRLELARGRYFAPLSAPIPYVVFGLTIGSLNSTWPPPTF
jgi:hypothetical protein